MARPSTGVTKRDLFNSDHGQGAGKGDKERSSNWRNNLDEIDWCCSPPLSMERIGHKLVKRYGAAAPEKFGHAPKVIVH